jgi:hypothetical protein
MRGHSVTDKPITADWIELFNLNAVAVTGTCAWQACNSLI